MSYNEVLLFCQNFSQPRGAKWLFWSVAFCVVWQIYSGVALLSTDLQRAVHSVPHHSITHERRLSDQGETQPFFGVYVPEQLDEMDVQESRLNVTIVGILLARNEQDSQVVLKYENQPEQTLMVGEALSNGAVIKRITKETVLLEYQGKMESVSLPKNELTFEDQAKPLIGE